MTQLSLLINRAVDLADAILGLIGDHQLTSTYREKEATTADERHAWDGYVSQALRLCGTPEVTPPLGPVVAIADALLAARRERFGNPHG